MTADRAVERSCSTAARQGAPGVAVERVTAPGTAMVSARLSDAAGNWNLAVFDAARTAVAASSFAGGDEVAHAQTADPERSRALEADLPGREIGSGAGSPQGARRSR